MILDYLVVGLYTATLVFIFIYALLQLYFLCSALKAEKHNNHLPLLDIKNSKQVPLVTIQLPIYNELYVVERLLHTIALIEYPKDKLDIQVLDDSTDESVTITAHYIKKLQASGLDIQHIRRSNRNGFKAGALKEGLKTAKGDYIAIFDADFMPQKKWLRRTLPLFQNKTIGLVQTRWEHINRNHSLLTKIQAFALDIHFTLEQVGRNYKHHFINFNGSAGIWRKQCILEAGNWQGDTLTEDLDLSYRAQLKNWQFKYVEEIETPAELPVVISAIRTQQFRWNKGGAENFRKLLKQILSNSTISLKTKTHCTLHLLHSSMYFNILLTAILSIPILYIKNRNSSLAFYFHGMSLFVLSSFILFICYWYVYKKRHNSSLKSFVEYLILFVPFFTVYLGFSLSNTIGVIEGHLGKRSPFIRTPKFNSSTTDKVAHNSNKYLTKNSSTTTTLEGILMLYFGFGIYSAFKVGNGDFGLLPFHIMLFLGFGFVFFKSLCYKA